MNIVLNMDIKKYIILSTDMKNIIFKYRYNFEYGYKKKYSYNFKYDYGKIWI